MVSHKARPRFAKRLPVHVTLRIADEVWNLGSGRSVHPLRACLAAAEGRFGLRIVDFGIQGNHLHLIVEADDSEALTRGMQGFCIRLAKSLNRMMGRSGRVFSDHYDSRLLRTPAELARARRVVSGA
jgi:REP element-mobilizing transposase RayT